LNPDEIETPERSLSQGVVFSLSGRLDGAHVAELQRLFGLEAAGQDVALDLQDVTLVDRDVVKFLARCGETIELKNCPAYIRAWVDTERRHSIREER
jgi:anti-anti-sigma regulatory factor